MTVAVVRSAEHDTKQHSENHILHTLLATQPPLLSGYSVAPFPLAISSAYSQARTGPWYARPLLSQHCPINVMSADERVEGLEQKRST